MYALAKSSDVVMSRHAQTGFLRCCLRQQDEDANSTQPESIVSSIKDIGKHESVFHMNMRIANVIH